MDMRGFNDSDKPEGIQNYFIMNMVEDIRGLVAGLGEKRFNQKKFLNRLGVDRVKPWN